MPNTDFPFGWNLPAQTLAICARDWNLPAQTCDICARETDEVLCSVCAEAVERVIRAQARIDAAVSADTSVIPINQDRLDLSVWGGLKKA